MRQSGVQQAFGQQVAQRHVGVQHHPDVRPRLVHRSLSLPPKVTDRLPAPRPVAVVHHHVDLGRPGGFDLTDSDRAGERIVQGAAALAVLGNVELEVQLQDVGEGSVEQ